jgi:prophage regulatory protein
MRILSYEDLRDVKGVPFSKTHLWRLEREGRFPKRVPIGAARHGWIDQEIDAWIEQRAAARADPNQLNLDLAAEAPKA